MGGPALQLPYTCLLEAMWQSDLTNHKRRHMPHGRWYTL